LLPNVRHITQMQSGDDALMLATSRPGNQSMVYRWTREQPPQVLASFSRPIYSLVADPDQSSDTAFYVLLESGEVVAVSEQGDKHSLGRRPGWPWDQAFELLAAPTVTGDGSLLLLGHTHGLLRFNASLPAPGERLLATSLRR
jgi:hypothetical protein